MAPILCFVGGWLVGWVALFVGLVIAARRLARAKHGTATGPNSREAVAEHVAAVLNGPLGRRVID